MSNRVHVLPLNDLIEHEETEDCVCGPDVELVSANNDGWLITHHSLDGREATEDGLPAPERFLAEAEGRDVLRGEDES